MILLSIIAALTIAIPGVGGTAQADARGVSPIRVLSTSHDVNFPDDIVFSLEAESNSPITEVRLFYSLGNRPIQVYGYAAFQPDKRVTAEFSVKTSGPNYIPSGVDFEYFYRVTDSSGNTLETDRSTFAYRDPLYEWRELQRGNLVVLWHNISQDRVERVVDDAVGRLAAVRTMFGLAESAPMKAVIVNGALEARRAFPYTSDAATRSHLYGGFAFGEYGLFVMQGLNTDIMVHEATHLLLNQAVASPLARVPAWLNEGLATYFESGGSRRGGAVSRAARSGDLLALKNMGSVPGRPRDVAIFYSQAWSTVKFMIDTYGPGKMGELLAAINEGNRIDEAIVKTYGVTIDELERLWKTDLTGQRIVIPRPDPGTVGTAGLFTGAVMVAVVVSTWRWIMRWLQGRHAVETGA